MRFLTNYVIILAFCAFNGSALAQRAAPPAEEGSTVDVRAAEGFIQKKHNRVRVVLRRPDTPKRAAELTELLGEFLDYDRLAKLSLDREWDKRSVKERERFVSLLRQLVERQYQRNMESTLEYKVSWVGSEAIDQESVLVKSSARSQKKRRQPPITIDYSMRPDEGQWRVWDIWTDGVSLVKNYRRQFRRVINDEGWDGLIDRMQKKLDEEE